MSFDASRMPVQRASNSALLLEPKPVGPEYERRMVPSVSRMTPPKPAGPGFPQALPSKLSLRAPGGGRTPSREYSFLGRVREDHFLPIMNNGIDGNAFE